jgi:hypothetical protein
MRTLTCNKGGIQKPLVKRGAINISVEPEQSTRPNKQLLSGSRGEEEYRVQCCFAQNIPTDLKDDAR